jgi:hypothetical protein
MPQILIDIADDSILVVDHGPIPLARRQRDPKGSHPASPPRRTLPPPTPNAR